MKWFYLIDAFLITLMGTACFLVIFSNQSTLARHQQIFTAQSKLFNETSNVLGKLSEQLTQVNSGLENQAKHQLAFQNLYTVQEIQLQVFSDKAARLLDDLRSVAEETVTKETKEVPAPATSPEPPHKHLHKANVNLSLPIWKPALPTATPKPTPKPKPTATPLIMNQGDSLYNSSYTQPFKH